MQSYKLGLALGSGGWRGLAHIGVIKSLIKHQIKISAIAGSSAGALIGGLFALTNDIYQVESMFNTLKYPDLIYAFSDPSAKLGLFSGKKTSKLFQKYTGSKRVEDCVIPFAAVATDILSGKPIVLSSGQLSEVIRASSSVPVIFEPVLDNQHVLVDGGVAHPIPVDVVKNMGMDFVIAVDVYHSMFAEDNKSIKLNKLNLINLSYHLLLAKLSAYDAAQADLVIAPQIENLSLDPFSKFIHNQQTIDQGEQAMDQAIPLLQQQLA